MASIQCAIELYDGVSPVLEKMSVNLEGFAEQFHDFGAQMQEFAPDMQGVEAFGKALLRFSEDAGGAYQVLGQIVEITGQMVDLFSEDIFASIKSGADEASLAIGEMLPQAELVAVDVEESFQNATEGIHTAFVGMQVEAVGQMNRISLQANAVAARLPGFFVGPLAQISGMFSSMAASAQASLNAITGASQRAVGAVQAAQRTVSSAAITPFSLSSGGAMGLPPIEAMGMGSGVEIQPLGAVTIHVQNDNYIGADVDVDAVLSEMEIRLADAVAMGMEGVYA